MWQVSVAFMVMSVLAGHLQLTHKVRPLTIRVGPAISFEPGSVRVTTIVEPNADNRVLVVEADSGEHFTSSDLPLDGNSPRSHLFELKDLPAGEYSVVVVLQRANGQETRTVGTFRVLGSRAELR